VQRVAKAGRDQALRRHSEAIAFLVMASLLVLAPMFA
jgi:hypothetical protein